MVDAPDDEVAAVLAAGPDGFVTTRTAHSRALRADGRREEAAALAKVRKPLRVVWDLLGVQRADPDLAERAAAAATTLEQAQVGRGGRVRPAMAALREVLDEVAAAADGSADVALAARQVLGDPDARAAWTEGRLLAVPGDRADRRGRPSKHGVAVRAKRGRLAATTAPSADAPGTAPAGRGEGAPSAPAARPSGPTRPSDGARRTDAGGRRRARASADAPSATADDDAEEAAAAERGAAWREEADREAAAREAAAHSRLEEATTARDEAARALASAEEAERTAAAALEEARGRRDGARDARERAASALAQQEEAVAAAKEETGERA